MWHVKKAYNAKLVRQNQIYGQRERRCQREGGTETSKSGQTSLYCLLMILRVCPSIK